MGFIFLTKWHRYVEQRRTLQTTAKLLSQSSSLTWNVVRIVLWAHGTFISRNETIGIFRAALIFKWQKHTLYLQLCQYTQAVSRRYTASLATLSGNSTWCPTRKGCLFKPLWGSNKSGWKEVHAHYLQKAAARDHCMPETQVIKHFSARLVSGK